MGRGFTPGYTSNAADNSMDEGMLSGNFAKKDGNKIGSFRPQDLDDEILRGTSNRAQDASPINQHSNSMEGRSMAKSMKKNPINANKASELEQAAGGGCGCTGADAKCNIF